MQNTVTPQTARRIILTIVAILVAIAALWLATRIPRTITIFLVAAFIAFGVQPIIVRLEERRVKRPLAIMLVFVVLLLLVVLGAVIILPLTLDQIQALIKNAPDYLKTTQGWILDLELGVRKHFPGANLPTSFDLQQFSSDKITGFVYASISSVGAFLLNAATALFIGVSALILSFFFLLQDRQIADGFAAMFPASKRATAREVAQEVTHIFGSFISGQVIVSAITGAAITILTAIFGFKYALILGLISAVAYAIPIVGMLAAHVIGAIIAAPQGVWMVVYVEVILFTIARISDNVLVPKIMGDSVGVSPIGVMFAVFAGGELFGLPGLVLGIPAAALIKVVWRYFIAPAIYGQKLEPVPTLPRKSRVAAKR
ncbi:MAG: hypothetical protein DLM50_05590 [Candidatus Meridianibacter frigidus]|nr:MAG: hypothetical protein DLM50_05590 [Candidatus Eremiobacteraeota bacterium]